MAPQQPAVAHLIQLRDPHSVFIRRQMLRHNVHSNFGKIQIGTNPCRTGDARSFQHIPDNLRCQLSCRHLVRIQIAGHIHKHLVYGIHMDILRSRVFQINIINTAAVLQIQCHSGYGRHKIHLQLRHILQLDRMGRSPGKRLSRSLFLPFCIHFPHFLHHLEQPGPSRNPISLQRRRNRQADGLIRTAFICHYQIRIHGIQPPLNALYRSVKGF